MSDDEIRQAIAAGLCDESIDHEFRSSQDCIERPCCLDICRGIHTERVPCGEYVEAMVEPVFARLVPLFARAEKAEAALNKVLLLLRKPGSPPPLPLEMEVEYWVREVKAEVARLITRLAKAEAVVRKLAEAWEHGESAACDEDDLMGDPETFEKFYRKAVSEAVNAGAAYVREFPVKETGR